MRQTADSPELGEEPGKEQKEAAHQFRVVLPGGEVLSADSKDEVIRLLQEYRENT